MMELSDDVSMVEIDAKDEWVNKNLVELGLRRKYGINVVAIRMNGTVKTDVLRFFL